MGLKVCTTTLKTESFFFKKKNILHLHFLYSVVWTVPCIHVYCREAIDTLLLQENKLIQIYVVTVIASGIQAQGKGHSLCADKKQISSQAW